MSCSHSARRSLAALAGAAVLAAGTAPVAAGVAKSHASGTLRPAPRGLPLVFEENRGQTDECVRFLARPRGMTAFLTDAGAVLALHVPGDDSAPDVVRLAFVGADRPAAAGRGALPGRSNYLVGSDAAKWITDVPHFDGAVVRGLYPGVDLAWRGDTEGRLTYDLVVGPGADAGRVEFAVHGARDLSVDGDGSLVAVTGRGALRQSAPVAFQEVDGVRRPVRAAFELTQAGRVRFEVGAYDARRPLVIDPTVTWSTYLGGSASDGGSTTKVAADSSGATYVVGTTLSANFPSAAGLQTSPGGAADVHVTKINAAGTAIVYSTYLGGSGTDAGAAVALDTTGAVFAGGYTSSANFPTLSPYQSSNAGGSSDGFVAKIDASGSALTWSTYLGGTADDRVLGLAVNASGEAYATGQTGSTDFPTQSAIQGSFAGGGGDAFVTKFNASGSALAYSTFLGTGGTGAGGTTQYDSGQAIAVDATGAAYVAGNTNAPGFPTQSSFQGSYAGGTEGFLAKLNPSGSALVYSTYVGGSAADSLTGVAVDGSGSAYVAGSTSSADFPTATPVQGTLAGPGDGCVLKLNPAGSALAWSTFLGGSANGDQAVSIAVTAEGAATVVGVTNSTDFPTLAATQPAHGGGAQDAFVTQYDSAGSKVVFSSYLGGSGNDAARGVAIDAAGASHVAGYTLSSNFPVQGAVQGSSGGGQDTFVVKFGGGGGGGPPGPPPPPPVGLEAAYVPNTGVVLDWTDSSTSEDGFVIERMPAGYTFVVLATTERDTNTLTDELLFPNATYTYRVRAFSYANGTSPWSNEASVTVPAGVTVPQPPRAPTQLVAYASDEGSIELAWTDNSSDEVRFGVDRAAGGASFASIAAVLPGVTGASDADVHPGWPYTYRVRALALQGPSPWSNVAAAVPPATLDVAVVAGSLTDSPKSRRDKLALAATYAPANDAAAPPDPVRDGLELQLGPTGAPLVVSVRPADPAWRLKMSKARKGAPAHVVSATWKSAKGVQPKVAVLVDFALGTVKATASGFDFGGVPSGSVRTLIACGADGGAATTTWTESKPGVFRSE